MSNFKLKVYDVSAVVWSGIIHDTYTVQGFPVGGIRYLTKRICYDWAHHSHVILCFDRRSRKRQYLPEYKSARNSGPMRHVAEAQINFIEEVMQTMGVCCLFQDGYEGDEMVYTAVESLRNSFMRVDVVSGDYDLAHNVCRNVDFEPANSQVHQVTLQSFSSAIEKHHILLPNTISAFKTFFGCSSDSIPPYSDGDTNKFLYDSFVQYLRDMSGGGPVNIDYSRDIRTLAQFLKQSPAVPSDQVNKLLTRAFLVYPAFCEAVKDRIIPTAFEDVNREKIRTLLSVIGDKPSMRILKIHPEEPAPETLEVYREMARSLRTGEYAVDKGLDFVTYANNVESSEVYMRSFNE